VRDVPLTPGPGGWLSALLVAALLHAALAAWALWSPAALPQGQTRAAGTGGVEISLGPAGRAAGGPESEPDPDPDPDPEPEPEPDPDPESEPEPPEPEPPEPEPPEPEPIAEPVATLPLEPVPDPPADRAPARASNVAGAAGQSGTREENNTGSGDNSAGGGLPGDTRDYAASLLAWLERHKEYPSGARLRRQEGTVMLYFVVDRNGRVLEYRLQRSSGHALLDEEVLAMIERAQPLPAMPASLDKQTLEVLVPLQFFIRR
jgi:periplasmic protein TonB